MDGGAGDLHERDGKAVFRENTGSSDPAGDRGLCIDETFRDPEPVCVSTCVYILEHRDHVCMRTDDVSE